MNPTASYRHELCSELGKTLCNRASNSSLQSRGIICLWCYYKWPKLLVCIDCKFNTICIDHEEAGPLSKPDPVQRRSSWTAAVRGAQKVDEISMQVVFTQSCLLSHVLIV